MSVAEKLKLRQASATCDECGNIQNFRGVSSKAIEDIAFSKGWFRVNQRLLCPDHNPTRTHIPTR